MKYEIYCTRENRLNQRLTVADKNVKKYIVLFIMKWGVSPPIGAILDLEESSDWLAFMGLSNRQFFRVSEIISHLLPEQNKIIAEELDDNRKHIENPARISFYAGSEVHVRTYLVE